MSDLSTINLADLVAKRRKCLVQLRDVGRTQFELVTAGQTAELLRLLGAKQQLLSALQAIERQLAPFQDQAPESRHWASAEARTRCAVDAEACRELLEEVVQLEQAAERQAVVRRDETAAHLKTVTSAGRVRDAYMQNDRLSPRAV